MFGKKNIYLLSDTYQTHKHIFDENPGDLKALFFLISNPCVLSRQYSFPEL